LGNAYSKLPIGDQGANLSRAIACYEQALRFRTPETAPHDYAMTQHNLGNAYSKLPIGDRGANLSRAIACYEETLHFQTERLRPAITR
jgi:tetratricopeptide (TPR) repeat protein